MTTDSLERALRRVEEQLLNHATPQGLVALRERGGEPGPAVGAAADIASSAHEDGSWSQSLAATANALLLIRELDPDTEGFGVERAVDRAFDWLRGRRGIAGAYAQGCTPERHALALCHHFVTGFFAPGVGDDVQGDDDSLALSSLALRAWCVWDMGGNDAALHLDALRRILMRRQRWLEPEPPGPSACLAALGALLAGGDRRFRPAIEHGVNLLMGVQRADGSWPGTDSFQALEILEQALRRGIAVAGAKLALYRGAELLAVTQQSDGTWGQRVRDATLLTGWRVLRRASGSSMDPNRMEKS